MHGRMSGQGAAACVFAFSPQSRTAAAEPERTMARTLQDDVHFRVLRALEQRPEISQRELAEELGIALGKVNFVLNAFAEKGLVKVRNFRTAQNKIRYAYVLTPAGIATKAELTAGFLRRKIREYEALRAEIVSLQSEMEGGVGQDSHAKKTGPSPAEQKHAHNRQST